ncbi:probable pectinesterase/pectinesterase inhibitor 51 [Tanacetum coccineum]|uniref:Probable pectinesterase/pectinesterase inhibitor 51 n=1 Tax=Tanacetum coccineum TaxID=301880 RepID=A0ABQ5CHB6_9ASTR
MYISLSFRLATSMASHFLFFFIFFVCTAAYNDPKSPHFSIQEACKATRFPVACQASLTNKSDHILPNASPYHILRSALFLSSKNLETTRLLVRAISRSSSASGDHNLTTTAKLCYEILGNSAYRIRSSEIKALPRSRIKDARAWTSAALTYQLDCLSGLNRTNNNTHAFVSNTVSFMNKTLVTSTSNALSMMMSYQLYGNQTSLWRSPKTERDGFWESVGRGSKTGLEPGVPTDLKPNVTVCKGVGVCTYEKVQDAVNAAPDNLSGKRRFVILIKEGVYKEIVRIGLAKRNVMLIGEGIGKTVITGSLNVGHLGITTYNTATVGVVGDGFMARDLTIQNTAGPGANQAVAFRSGSDLSVVENCEFIGNQDTLYAHSLRQLYKSCIIQGNVDFIFGSSASVFHNCTILIRPRQLDPMKGGNSVISAHGRMDPAQTAGFIFQECVITGTKEYMQLIRKVPRLQQTTFLGRPWKEFSRCVYVRCKLDAIVSPLGWLPWDGDFALSTLYFGEFGNTGLGSNLSERVTWSSRTPSTHVDVYSVKNFIQGDEWRLT